MSATVAIAFFGISALVFALTATATVVWCAPMASMGMPMPGGWTMSMAWMRMPGQTWPGAAAMFLGMWIVMMVAMMLPSLVPTLWSYARAISRRGEARPGQLTTIVALGYFVVWTAFGLAAYLLGVAWAELTMRQVALSHAVPFATGIIVLLAGVFQFTVVKAHHLSSCRVLPAPPATRAGAAWRYGVRLGLHCSYCCAGLMVLLLVVGVMDLRAMALVAAAITVERLAPGRDRAARAIGVVAIATGLLLIARATRLV